MTNQFGLLNLLLGEGDSLAGDWNGLEWGNRCYFLKIDAVVNGGAVDLGMSKVVGVPFAKASGDWANVGDTVLHSKGRAIGIGVSSPLAKLHLVNKFETAHHLNGGSTFILGPTDQSNLRLGVHQDYSWIQSHDLRPLAINPLGNPVGIGLNTPTRALHVKEGQGSSIVARFESTNVGGATIDFRDPNTLGDWVTRIGSKGNDLVFMAGGFFRMYMLGSNGNIGIGTTTPQAKLDVNGRSRTHCLEITGGCDIKEDLNSKQDLEPGDVVVIDEKNPGQIRRTDEKYDRKVAGIISGANGINPGISLSQDDVLTGDYPLTMVGRVYIKVVGKVEVGDMLTTSHLPGHAMAVSDFSKAKWHGGRQGDDGE